MRVIHFSANTFKGVCDSGHTSRIWRELSLGVEEYVVFARNSVFKFSETCERSIRLLKVPSPVNRSWIYPIMSLFYLGKAIKVKPDLSIVQSPLTCSLPALILKLWVSTPILLEFHSDIYWNLYKRNVLFRYYFRFLIKNVSKVRALSDAQVQAMLLLNIPEEKITVVPNRVDLSLFAPKKINYKITKDITVVSVGRFVPQKGYDIAIKAIQQLEAQGMSIKLILIGGGQERKSLESLISRSKNIELINWIDQTSLVSIMRDADIYIQPSKQGLGEAMPRTLLEAMALGLPIIVSPIAGIPSVVEDLKTGLYVVEGDINNLMVQIRLLVENDGLREELGNNAYNKVSSDYTWDRCFDLYRSVLKEAMLT